MSHFVVQFTSVLFVELSHNMSEVPRSFQRELLLNKNLTRVMLFAVFSMSGISLKSLLMFSVVCGSGILERLQWRKRAMCYQFWTYLSAKTQVCNTRWCSVLNIHWTIIVFQGVTSLCLDRFGSSLFAAVTDNCVYEYGILTNNTKPSWLIVSIFWCVCHFLLSWFTYLRLYH